MVIQTLFILVFISFMAPVYGSDIHLRAREHYELVKVDNLGRPGLTRYEGLTNTLDLWYEVPFRYSFGIAGGPLIATLPVTGSDHAGRPQRIRLMHLGIESKIFLLPEFFQGFVRVGTFYSALASRDDLGSFYGSSILLGIGYELDWNGTGIAPEFDWRFGKLNQGISFQSAGPAIGLHFYTRI